MNQVESMLNDALLTERWRQPRKLTVSEWADEHRVLDRLFAAEPGPWRTSRNPYTREWMDSANVRWVRNISIQGGTQVGKSEAVYNILGFYIHQKPSPTMVVLPNRDASRVATERRVMPMVRASEALRGELTNKAHDQKNREVLFKRSVIYMRSANSPTDLASVPVRLVIGDETDKWPEWSGKEADPLDLVVERTRTYYDCVVVLACTPTVRSGVIHQQFLEGDQRRYWVPCPHCEKHQVLEFGQIKWPEDIKGAKEMKSLKVAWYECPHCKGRIDDHHKREMLEQGVWIPKGDDYQSWVVDGNREEDRNEHRSYHIWAAYSPWLFFWKIVAKYLATAGKPKKKKNFSQNWLAEPWEESVNTTTEQMVEACVDKERPSFDVPDEVKVITCTVDVQKDYLQWMLAGWGADEESWVIAMQRCEKWSELTDIVKNNVYGSSNIPVSLTLIDARGGREGEVLEWCRESQPTRRMIKGVERDHPVPFKTIQIDKHPKTGKTLKSSMTIWTVNVGQFKDLVAFRLRLALKGQEESKALIHLPNDFDEAEMRQVSSEHKVLIRSGRKERRLWIVKPGHERNEAWDLLVYQAAAARMKRMDLLRSDGDGNLTTPPKPPPRPKPNQRRRGGRFPTLS